MEMENNELNDDWTREMMIRGATREELVRLAKLTDVQVLQEFRTQIQTIRANLQRNEKGEIEWKVANDGKWNIAGLTESGLIGYFEPQLAIGVDQYGNEITDPLRTIHIKKRQTGAKESQEWVQRMIAYYPLLPTFLKPSRFQRIINWFKGLWSGRRGK